MGVQEDCAINLTQGGYQVAHPNEDLGPGTEASKTLARAIIAEVGLDMARFPTARHLVSWAGLCPSARQSGTRTRAGKKGRGNTWLRNSLGQAAIGAARTTTFLGERYLAPHHPPPGKATAQVAVARSILVISWHLLSDPAARYTDLGPGYHQSRTDKGKKIKNHIRQIKALLDHPITIGPWRGDHLAWSDWEEDKCGLLFLEAHRHLKCLAEITAQATDPA